MNFCFEAESSNSQHLQKDFACSKAVRQKPSDSRSPFSTRQACCPEGFQKLGNTVSVSCNRLPTLNSNRKANRSCITSPFSCKANPAPAALLTTSQLAAAALLPRAQTESRPADSLRQDTTYEEFPAKPPVSCRNRLFLC